LFTEFYKGKFLRNDCKS